MLPPKSTEPWLALGRLARARRAAAGATRAARSVGRPVAIRTRRATPSLSVADGAAILRSAAVALRHTVHRPLRLHLLARADRITFLQKLRECGTRTVRDGVLKLLRQIRECDVRMDRLNIAQELVRQAA